MELGVDEERRCREAGPGDCGATGGKGCGRTFNAVTGAPLSGPGLHRKDRRLSFGEAPATGETVKASAERCGVSAGTAFRRRRRFLEAVAMAPEKLKGIIEADETYAPESRKGERTLKRRGRRRGGKASRLGLSREQVPVSMAAARGGVRSARCCRRSPPTPCGTRSNPQSRKTSGSFPTPTAFIPLARPRPGSKPAPADAGGVSPALSGRRVPRHRVCEEIERLSQVTTGAPQIRHK